MTIRVMLLDDHAVVRTGYRRLVDAEGDMVVVAEAASAEEACAFLRAEAIDVAVVDLSLRCGSGIEAITRLLARQPTLRAMVFSMHDEPDFAVQALKAGALGYLTKYAEPTEMLDGIRRVFRGERVLSPTMAQSIALQSLDGGSPMHRLTPREFEILRLTVQGEATIRIASQLHLSPKTIFNHMSAIRQKLEVSGDMALFQLAARHGLIAAPAGWEGRA
ncbi:response regulator transcription factor [Denitratisoma sp. agr-D3]